jgi:hypothetical protein
VSSPAGYRIPMATHPATRTCAPARGARSARASERGSERACVRVARGVEPSLEVLCIHSLSLSLSLSRARALSLSTGELPHLKILSFSRECARALPPLVEGTPLGVRLSLALALALSRSISLSLFLALPLSLSLSLSLSLALSLR